MVNDMFRRNGIVYQCEFCGFGYSKLETAESCEEFCGTHGTCSPEITLAASLRPSVQVIPLSGYAKIFLTMIDKIPQFIVPF